MNLRDNRESKKKRKTKQEHMTNDEVIKDRRESHHSNYCLTILTHTKR